VKTTQPLPSYTNLLHLTWEQQLKKNGSSRHPYRWLVVTGMMKTMTLMMMSWGG